MREPVIRVWCARSRACAGRERENETWPGMETATKISLNQMDTASDEDTTLKLMREQEEFEQNQNVSIIEIVDESQTPPNKADKEQTIFSSGEEDEEEEIPTFDA